MYIYEKEVDGVSIRTIQQRSSEDIAFYRRLNRMDYYVVCDGHGDKDNLKDGHVAHTIVYGYRNILPLHMELYVEFEKINFDVKLIPDVIRRVFKSYDEEMFKQNCRGGSCFSSILVIDKTYAFVINSGDSRACVWNSDKLIKSRDHDYDNPSERERVRNLGGVVIFGRLFGIIMTFRSFGDWNLKVRNGKYTPDGPLSCIPEIDVVKLDDSMSGLITSDAISDVRLTPEVLTKTIDKCEDKTRIAHTIAETVVHVSSHRYSKYYTNDDISVIYIQDLTK